MPRRLNPSSRFPDFYPLIEPRHVVSFRRRQGGNLLEIVTTLMNEKAAFLFIFVPIESGETAILVETGEGGRSGLISVYPTHFTKTTRIILFLSRPKRIKSSNYGIFSKQDPISTPSEGFWGSVLDSLIPCTRKVSVRQRYKGDTAFVTVLNKDDLPAETLRVHGMKPLVVEPFSKQNRISKAPRAF